MALLSIFAASAPGPQRGLKAQSLHRAPGPPLIPKRLATLHATLDGRSSASVCGEFSWATQPRGRGFGQADNTHSPSHCRTSIATGSTTATAPPCSTSIARKALRST
jgi:hypothetical protein